jgi:hypothetical protein|tara:strand:- start:288 stop:482 length:195 start_codon:yes stop_codon:yes gene_type:complete
MILEQFLELIEEDKNIVDDIEEINIIFKELGYSEYHLKKKVFEVFATKNPKYIWDKEKRTLRMK